jgi:hypothetical protein
MELDGTGSRRFPQPLARHRQKVAASIADKHFMEWLRCVSPPYIVHLGRAIHDPASGRVYELCPRLSAGSLHQMRRCSDLFRVEA